MKFNINTKNVNNQRGGRQLNGQGQVRVSLEHWIGSHTNRQEGITGYVNMVRHIIVLEWYLLHMGNTNQIIVAVLPLEQTGIRQVLVKESLEREKQIVHCQLAVESCVSGAQCKSTLLIASNGLHLQHRNFLLCLMWEPSPIEIPIVLGCSYSIRN